MKLNGWWFLPPLFSVALSKCVLIHYSNICWSLDLFSYVLLFEPERSDENFYLNYYLFVFLVFVVSVLICKKAKSKYVVQIAAICISVFCTVPWAGGAKNWNPNCPCETFNEHAINFPIGRREFCTRIL